VAAAQAVAPQVQRQEPAPDRFLEHLDPSQARTDQHQVDTLAMVPPDQYLGCRQKTPFPVSHR
jgi:hypothetical protein